MKEHLLGFDIGGTKCAVVLGRLSPKGAHIVDRREFPTDSAYGPERTLQRLEEYARSIVDDQHLLPADLRAVGISCGGPLDSHRGVILGPPNLPGWDNIEITSRFESAFGVPCRLENDANACALAEWKWGAGRGCRHMIFLTFGTGLGAGLILDGRLYVGANDLAGEVGHVRLAEDGPLGYGKRGSFEGFCSGGGIFRLAQQVVRQHWDRHEVVPFCRTEDDLANLTAKVIAEAAQSGDRIALEILQEVGRYLGRGLAMLIDIFNPEIIILGSIFVRQRDLLWPIAEQIICEEALPMSREVCRIVPAELGESIGDYASVCVAARIPGEGSIT